MTKYSPKYRAYRAAKHKRYRARTKEAVFEHYGKTCVCCGEERLPFLSIDHIDGGGKEPRRSIGACSSTQFYKWVRNNKLSNLQVLCYNCNRAKGFYGVCPHTEVPVNG